MLWQLFLLRVIEFKSILILILNPFLKSQVWRCRLKICIKMYHICFKKRRSNNKLWKAQERLFLLLLNLRIICQCQSSHPHLKMWYLLSRHRKQLRLHSQKLLLFNLVSLIFNKCNSSSSSSSSNSRLFSKWWCFLSRCQECQCKCNLKWWWCPLIWWACKCSLRWWDKPNLCSHRWWWDSSS